MSHSINDVYVLGHLSYQTDQNGTTLATFTYDSSGVPASVQVGSDPNTSPRYYYVYNGHGDVVALVDATGASVASYTYDAFGQITAASENFGSGTTTWTNPYRYDGRDGVRSDGETGLSWMSVRAYDPALGRFLSRDPLGRVPLFFADQPYVYGGNNPLVNIDPSGQFELTDGMSRVQVRRARAAANQKYVKWFRMQSHPGKKAGLASLANPAKCKRVCLESIRSALTVLSSAIGPFTILSDWPTVLGYAGFGGSIIAGVLEAAGKLKGLPLVGGIVGAFLTAAVMALWFLGQTVHSILDGIRDMKEEVDHAEVNGDNWDSSHFTAFMGSARDQMGHLMFGYGIGIAVGIIGGIIAAIGNPFTQVATAAAFGVGVGSAAGLLMGGYINHQLDGFDLTVRAAGGA